MLAIAPVSVMLMGLLGVLALGTAVLRIVLAERKLQLATVHRLPVAPAAPAAGTSTLAA